MVFIYPFFGLFWSAGGFNCEFIVRNVRLTTLTALRSWDCRLRFWTPLASCMVTRFNDVWLKRLFCILWKCKKKKKKTRGGCLFDFTTYYLEVGSTAWWLWSACGEIHMNWFGRYERSDCLKISYTTANANIDIFAYQQIKWYCYASSELLFMPFVCKPYTKFDRIRTISKSTFSVWARLWLVKYK